MHIISIIKSLINRNSPPLYLYKYYAVDDYSMRVITHNEVYFSAPSKFNDPFDCKNEYRFDVQSKSFAPHMWKIFRENNPNPDDEGEREKMEVLIRDYQAGKQRLPQNYESDLANRSAEKIGVFCLTSTPDNILMWSHYSNNHKGFVVKINMENLLGSLLNVLGAGAGISFEKVVYSKKYPDIEYFSSSVEERVQKVVQYKSSHWKYEKEWRIVVWDYGNRPFRSGKRVVDAVYLGCQISDADRLNIERVAQIANVPVSQMRKMKYSYGLEY